MDSIVGDGDVCVSLGNDQRIRVWNVETGALSHSIQEPGVVGLQALSASNSLVAIVGTAGTVFLFDTKAGTRLLSLKHSNNVDAIAFSGSGLRLFVAAGRRLVVWDITTGNSIRVIKMKSTNVACIASDFSGDRIAIADSTIQLFCVSTAKRLARYVGHQARATSLRFTPGQGHYLVSTGKYERVVSVWSTNPPSSVKMNHVAFQLQSKSVCSRTAISLLPNDAGMVVVSLSESHESTSLSLWTIGPKSELAVTPSKCDAWVKNTLLTDPIQGVFFNSATSLTVIRGSFVFPMFDKVVVVDSDFKAISSVLKSPDSCVSPEKFSGQKRRRNEGDVHVVNSESLRSRRIGVAASSPTDHMHDINQNALSHFKDTTPVQREEVNQPTASSIHRLLSQALHSNDKKSLEYCFQQADSKIMIETVKRMALPSVLPLLNYIIARIQSKPSRSSMLLPWVQTVLVHHAGYLISLKDLPESKLDVLYRTIKSRIASFHQFVELQGRLDMVFAQIENRQRYSVCGLSQLEPISVYNDDEE